MVKKIINAMGLSQDETKDPWKELLEITLGSVLVVAAFAAFYILMAVCL